MIIVNFISALSENAIICSSSSTNLMVYDKNELRIIVGFVKHGNSIEYVKEVCLKLSTEIPERAKITEIVISKNGSHAILLSTKSAFVVRINQEFLMTKTDQLSAEYPCECYPLHESFLSKSLTLTIIQARILQHKVNNMTIIAVLFSDNCIRFYDINKKNDGLLLSLDFRPYVNDGFEIVSMKNNTLGLHKNIISFDFKPTIDSTLFSILAVDSDNDFYSSTVFSSCFTEAETPRIDKIDSLDSLPCNPISLQFIDTPGQEIASVFVLLSAGCKVTHLIAIPDELNAFELLIYDQLQIPSIGEPKLLPIRHHFYNRNRYEIATSTSLYSINISSWTNNLISNSPASSSKADGETVVTELLNLVDREVSNEKGRTLNATSLVMRKNDYENEDAEEFVVSETVEVLHLVILKQTYVAAISTFTSSSPNHSADETSKKENARTSTNMNNKSTIAMIIGSLKTLPACVISPTLTEEEAIASVMQYLKSVEEKLRSDKQLIVDAIELCTNLQIGSQSAGEEQQAMDDRLIKETMSVEELKTRMYKLKGNIETVRKTFNEIISRVEDNAPLSEMEYRIFDRLKYHQNMLSQLSIKIPKLALDLNEKRRVAQSIQMRKVTNQPNKFANVEKNSLDIENLVRRIERIQNEMEKITA